MTIQIAIDATGRVMAIGDYVDFKEGTENSGQIVNIKDGGNQVQVQAETEFEGAFIGGETEVWIPAKHCYLQVACQRMDYTYEQLRDLCRAVNVLPEILEGADSLLKQAMDVLYIGLKASHSKEVDMVQPPQRPLSHGEMTATLDIEM